MRDDVPSAIAEPAAEVDGRARRTMVDLFAGCGGLSLGFEQAGFEPVFVNELDEHAMATYLANRRHQLGGMPFAENLELRCRDAHELEPERLDRLESVLSSIPELDFQRDRLVSEASGGGSTLDVLTGGPPCQGYSGIGIRRSYSVDREEIPSNHLYVRMAHAIRHLRPRIFLFENVRGLLNARWTRDGPDQIWPDVWREFSENIPGYEVRWKLVRAMDYGVPQHRPRVLVVGIRRDVLDACASLDPAADEQDAIKCSFLPQPAPGTYPNLEDLLGDLVDEGVAKALRNGVFPQGTFKTAAYPRDPQTEIQRRLRHCPPEFRDRDGQLTDQEYSRHKPEVVQKFDHMIRHGGEIPAAFKTKKFSQRVLRRRWENRTPNITATSLPDDYVHYEQPRILTVREWARLQLFPDWYEFKGKRTTGGLRRAGNPREGLFDREVPKYTQIGNAVPVGLASAVGAHFARILDEALGENAREERHEHHGDAGTLQRA